MKSIWALQLFISNKSRNHTYLLGRGQKYENELTKKVFELKPELVCINKSKNRKIFCKAEKSVSLSEGTR